MVAAVLVAIVVIVILIRIGYAYQWTGFGEEKLETENRDARPKKTLWDWLQLGGTLAIPIAIALFGIWYTEQQDRVNREIEAQRAEQVTLQAYLDQMGTLLLDRDLHDSSEDSNVSRVARARTLVVLDALESSDRQRRVLRFLYETELIQEQPSADPIIRLDYADLRNYRSDTTRLLKGASLVQATLDEQYYRKLTSNVPTLAAPSWMRPI
jgi:hypothetical protein